MLLGLCLYYMFIAGSEPWSEANFKRWLSCDSTDELKAQTSATLYLYSHVTKFLNENTCMPYDDTDPAQTNMFNGPLFATVLATWIICFICICNGVKSSSYAVMLTVPVPFVLLFLLMAYYIGLNNGVDGKGVQFYFGGQSFPSGVNEKDRTMSVLLIDSFNQVFYSISVCVGVMFAYGSYNPIRKPVIQDAVVMAVLDFFFSILAGFITWGVIGYLFAKSNPAFTQTSSVGLAFVAFPTAATLDGSKGWFGLFCFFMFIAGIDSAFSYIEAFNTNIVDATGCARWKAALGTCILGIVLSLPFTTNFGWTLFDLTEHYLSGYIIILVGFLQCVAVAWFFEYESTAMVSENHRKSLKVMSLCYWVPLVIVAFYANFAFPEQKFVGIVVIFITSLLALFFSFKASGMKFNSWYHEIVLCGVDKLSMSITSLSNPDG